MRTNIDIDDELMEQAKEFLGTRTKKETVDEALRLVLRRRAIEGLLAMRGKVEFWEDYDYKAMREAD
jgi:Arc/MetJ family transcription regulator